MEDKNYQVKYQKYKYKVKLWEKDFKKKRGRIPSKHDIREAPLDIRQSYKMYYKLKTSFLEDTLGDILSDDGFEFSQDSTQCDISPFGSPVIKLPSLPASLSSTQGEEQIQSEESGFGTFSNIKELSGNGLSVQNITNINEEDVIIKHFEPVATCRSNDTAWKAKTITKNPERQKNCSYSTDNFKSKLSKKLFASSSFTKRNPRKSLSKSDLGSLVKTSSNNSLNNSQQSLPDFETILSQKSLLKQKENLPQGLINKPTEIVTDIDLKWLNRHLQDDEKLPTDQIISMHEQKDGKSFGISNLRTENLKPNEKEKDVTLSVLRESYSFGISKLQLNSEEQPKFTLKVEAKFAENDSDSVISNSEDESQKNPRHILKKRKIVVSASSPLKNLSKKSPLTNTNRGISNINVTNKETPNKSMEMENTSQTNRKSKQNLAKKDVVNVRKSITKKNVNQRVSSPKNKKINETNSQKIAAKPSEPQMKNKTKATRTSRSKKVNTVEASPPEEEEANTYTYTPFIESDRLVSLPRVDLDELKNVDSYVEQYIYSGPSQPKRATIKSSTVVNEKQALARSKLEDKVVSGKLNENFVCVNLRKKTFVRGKKTLNFSKYKKKLWKHNKRIAALSGPDMDMRGCDGGVLTCFTCNGVGHFAQNCTVKGDNLLPIDAHIVDDSPFPTLEEAETMANYQALSAHSRNMGKLPKATNSKIYETQENLNNTFSNEIDNQTADIHLNAEILEAMETSQFLEEKESEVPPTQSTFIGRKIPEEFLKKAGLLGDFEENKMSALYNLHPDGTLIETPEEVNEALRLFGHNAFRKGQDRAIMRILSGLSTLVTLSTGSGKSLCYQLPAYLYSRKKKCITLVISPLVSLMEDQVHGVPAFLNAQCLHTNQTPQQKEKIMEMIRSGNLDILLVSPEAVVAGERSTGFGSMLRQLPPIAFACIDEVHCVSQWSHNFRPSYLMICKVLSQKLGIKTILGLTATATVSTRLSIVRHLGIADGTSGIISDIPLPDNLIISVSKDVNRDNALLRLLRSERFKSCQSIIIYCTRRDECERIATFLRTCLQDSLPPNEINKRKRKRINWNAEAYHAGMVPSRRKTVQNAFMRNQLRIVVATIAFGMGINKSDIRAIIHYNMPRNFESYVQEVGRSGRDGKIAHCHLFLDSKGTDQSELMRHIFANSIDRHAIRKLLQNIFLSCACENNRKKEKFRNEYAQELRAVESFEWNNDFTNNVQQIKCNQLKWIVKRSCPGHEVGFSTAKTVEALDIPEENISTLLCYLELDGRFHVKVLSNAYTMCKIMSYSGSRQLKLAAKDCPPLAMAIALEMKKGTFDEQATILEFSVIEIASAIGWDSGIVKYQLKNLEWTTVDNIPKRSSVSVTFFELGFRVRSPGDLTDEELDETLEVLYERSIQQEKSQLIQLQYIFDGLSSVAFDSFASSCEKEMNLLSIRSDALKKIIRNYFQNEVTKDMEARVPSDTTGDQRIIDDVRTMISIYPENNFSGRTIARIFHGIQSPNYPAVIWGRCKYWRAHSKVDFNRICTLANSVIVKLRT